jgi:hypothetical protein
MEETKKAADMIWSEFAKSIYEVQPLSAPTGKILAIQVRFTYDHSSKYDYAMKALTNLYD